MVKTAATRKVKTKKTTKKVLTKQKPKNNKKVAIVVSLFNPKICQSLLKGSLKELKKNGFSEKSIKVFEVSGAFEIPLVAKKIALTKKYHGIIALGCVIRGDTPHFEYVSLAATLGCLQAGLDSLCPVAFGVITVNNQKQALERSRSNKYNKGREAALALLDTFETLGSI